MKLGTKRLIEVDKLWVFMNIFEGNYVALKNVIWWNKDDSCGVVDPEQMLDQSLHNFMDLMFWVLEEE